MTSLSILQKKVQGQSLSQGLSRSPFRELGGFLLLLAFAIQPAAAENIQNIPDYKAEFVAAADSLTEDNGIDTTLYTRRNVAVGFNSLDYLLEKRHLEYGDQFTKKWDDHLFIEGGLGVEHVIAPTKDYKFTPITTARIAVGKQFNKKNSLRLSLYGGYAYQYDKDFFMLKYGARLEHIFDFSSYFAGYDPTRRVSLSSILGLGVAGSSFKNNAGLAANSGVAAEAHVGLQFKFFTGPQGYVNIEPIIGLATDQMDVSGQRNWRKYDAFYGANLSYVYYIHNNLSPEARSRYLTKRKLRDDITTDSTLYSWQKPAFIEISNSVHPKTSNIVNFFESASMGYTFSIGKWFSPAIALRASLSVENTTFYSVSSAFNGETKYELTNYLLGKVDALFNPFGLVRHYNWDSRFGFYGVLGLQIGKVYKEDSKVNCMVQGFDVGLHLWARLAEGLKVFIEPRYEHFIYHTPEKEDQIRRYGNNMASLNVGITVDTRTRKYTDWGIYEELDYVQFMRPFTVGIGGGINYLQTTSQYESAIKLGFNVQLFGEYHFNDIHSARLSLEYTRHPLLCETAEGLRRYNFENGLLSLDYMICLTNLLHRTNPDGRGFDAFLFVGPSMSVGRNPDEGNKLTTPNVTFNIGAKLLYKLNRHIGFHLTPTFYYVTDRMKNSVYPNVKFNSHTFTMFETINAGVQYTF
ncbi:MAG: hypothetical protein HUK06_06865 [Bacteroidaceae bacterium]|nr:hypothetical protein [Bacteroidaceae bacterium]